MNRGRAPAAGTTCPRLHKIGRTSLPKISSPSPGRAENEAPNPNGRNAVTDRTRVNHRGRRGPQRSFSRKDARIAKIEHLRFASSWRSRRLGESRSFRAPRFRALNSLTFPRSRGRISNLVLRTFPLGFPLFPCFPRPLSGYWMKRRRSGWRVRYVGRVC